MCFQIEIFHVLVKAFIDVMTECGKIRPSLQERVLASLKSKGPQQEVNRA